MLLLSALGASLDLEGNWPRSAGSGLGQWKQITAQGRDQYVRIVRRGYLFPVGHPAVLVEIVERVFVVDPEGRVDGYLVRKSFIKVNKPLKTYPALGQPFGGRSWPFTSVLIATAVSPLLGTPTLLPFSGADPQSGFPQQAGGGDVQWTLVATDAAGHRTTFAVPLAFVFAHSDAQFDVAGYTQGLAASYNNNNLRGRRTGDAGGAHVQFAPETPGHAAATTHPAVTITLAASTTVTDPNTPTANGTPTGKDALTAADQPGFYPSLGEARIRLAAAEALSRKPIDDPSGPGIGIAPYGDYVVNGLVNKGGVYAHTNPAAPPSLNFAADAVGAVAKPDFTITGLSASAGAVGGSIDRYARDAVVVPEDYFAGALSAKLLGGLRLIKMIGTMPAPTVLNLVDPATRVRTIAYHIVAPLKQIPGVFDPSPNSRLVMDAVAVIDPAGNSSYKVDGHIEPFTIHILGTAPPLGFLDIPFNNVHFSAANGAKPNVDVDIGQVQFQGVLRFVNELQKFLQNLGGSGFSVNVSPSAVDAGMSLGLPSFGVGVFNMANLSLHAGVHVPFTGDGFLARFSFSTREHPFLLTVMCFGGGGFVGLGVGLSQVEIVEASLEFGAQLALDIGVASGGVTVVAGVYFKYDANKGVLLSGFVRITGELEVLGLVSISADLNLELSYQPKSAHVPKSTIGGTATLRVEISIAFFSTSAELSVHREFAGADPSFQDMVPDQPTWQAYCDAFAA